MVLLLWLKTHLLSIMKHLLYTLCALVWVLSISAHTKPISSTLNIMDLNYQSGPNGSPEFIKPTYKSPAKPNLKAIHTVNAPPAPKMSRVRILNATFIPQNKVTAKYRGMTTGKEGGHDLTGGKPRLLDATFELNTTRPAINLDNYNLGSIHCSNPDNGANGSVLISLTFKTVDEEVAAYNAWSTVEGNFIAFIGHEHSCLGINKFSAVDVHEVKRSDTDLVMHLNANFLGMREAILDIGIAVKHITPPKPKYNSTNLGWDWDNIWKLPLDANYNPATDSATRQTIPVYTNQDDSVELESDNCYSHGEIDLELHLQCTWSFLTYYQVSVRGDLKANIDATLRLKGGAGNKEYESLLFTVGLEPLQVPGLFELGPQAQLYSGVSFGANSVIEIRTGLDAWFKFDWKMVSSWGMFSFPVFSSTGSAGINPHKVTITTSETVDPALHVTPAIALKIVVFNFINFQLDIKLDNALGVHLDTIKDNGCPYDKATNMQLFHEHKVILDVVTPFSSNSYSLWDSGEEPINCSWCHQCIGKI